MTVRVGMIGAGRMANVHANCMADIPEAKIVAVADILPERAQALSGRTGAAAYTDYRKMLDREQLDAVYVATPTGLHAEHAMAVAEHKLPFFVEKPLALKMSDGWDVQRAAERNGVLSFVGYQWRYTEAVDKAREILGDRPLAVTACEWLWTIPPVPWFRIKEAGRRPGGGSEHAFDRSLPTVWRAGQRKFMRRTRSIPTRTPSFTIGTAIRLRGSTSQARWAACTAPMRLFKEISRSTKSHTSN